MVGHRTLSKFLYLKERILDALRARDPRSQSFVRFLRRNRVLPSFWRKKNIVLVHVNKIPSSHVGLALAVPEYCTHVESQPVGFYSDFQHGNLVHRFSGSLATRIQTVLDSAPESIVRALGVRKIIRPSRRRLSRTHVARDFAYLKETVRTKSALEDFELHGVWIGDLIYDQYLAESKAVTANLADPRLWSIALRAVELLHAFVPIFEKKTVAGVFGVGVYFDAIPVRIAIAKGIPAFQADISLQRLGLPMVDGNFTRDFPAEFEKTGLTADSPELKRISDYVHSFVAGKRITPIFGHSFRSFLPPEKAVGPVLSPGPKFKVLVAPHNPFSDSPHVVGRGLFPDYGEWLEFIGQLSNTLDFDWYLKMHPDQRDQEMRERNRDWLTDFCARFANVTLLPEAVAHGQLIDEGIGAVLTVHGSIGFEYSLKGIPVVNASINNPHKPFGFTLSPSSVEELREMTAGLPNFRGSPLPIESIIRYCYMWLFHYSTSPVYGDLGELEKASGYHGSWENSGLYDLFAAEWGSDRNLQVRKTLAGFFDSPDRFWLDRHMENPD